MCKRLAPTLLSSLAAAAIALAGVRVLAAAPNHQKFDMVERGRYLTTLADCAACHTNPGVGKSFAGGRPIETPFGTVVSANITPDSETGIGNWTDEQFDNAVRHGVRADGKRLYPAMPYPFYAKMSREDVKAIRAYLATIAPVHNPVVSDQLPFPLSIREGMRVWNALYFNGAQFQSNPDKSPQWNRGAYLVNGPGHCGACHTPKTMLGGDKTSKALQGYQLQGWFAPNITNDKAKGLGSWSKEDIASFLKTGHNRMTTVTGPMAEEIEHSSSRWTQADLEAIATYLKDLPGTETSGTPVAAKDAAMQAGQAIYRDVCSACHQIDGKGVANLFPSLSDSAALRADDPTTAIRIILRGARSVATSPEPTAPGMPSFGWQLNDAQVAAVLTYIRNSWGSAAPAVSAKTVTTTRQELSARND